MKGMINAGSVTADGKFMNNLTGILAPVTTDCGVTETD
jgi:hypothetical protein